MDGYISPIDAVNKLNELAKRDPVAILKLFTKGFACNQDLHDFTPMALKDGKDEDGNYNYCIRPIGILNHLFGVFEDGPKNGWGKICMKIDDRDPMFCEFGLVENKY